MADEAHTLTVFLVVEQGKNLFITEPVIGQVRSAVCHPFVSRHAENKDIMPSSNQEEAGNAVSDKAIF
jgi:hypothetical protein